MRLLALSALALIVIAPLSALGLTGGPSEPAASGPAALSTDNLVDLFTGDFQYSIPLFELPGPQGRYPFAIGYHSGVQTEQEASWVGLGWTFEPGRISRTVRGIPDDVAGDEIHQLFQQRDAVAYGATGTVGVEVFGLDSRLLKLGANVGLEVFFDSYSGYGMGLLLSPSASVKVSDSLGASLGVSADLNTHHGMSVGTSLGLNIGLGQLNPSYGASYNPTTGLQSAYWGYSSVPLFSPAYVAAAQRSQWGDRNEFSMKVGGELWGVFLEGKVSGYYGNTHYALPATQKAYGYLHLQEATDRDNSQLDFAREKDGPLKPKTPYLPLAFLASDAFQVATSGGLAGSFRAYRNDIPVLGDPSVGSANTSASVSAEIGTGALVHAGASEQLATAESESSTWLPSGFVDAARGGDPPQELSYFALSSDLAADEGIAHADEARFINLPSTTTASATLKGLNGSSSTLPRSNAVRPRATRIRAVTEDQVQNGTATWLAQFNNAHLQRPSGQAGTRVGGFEVTLTDGTRYVFGQPAYVDKEINCTFSVEPGATGLFPGQSLVKIPDSLKGGLQTWFDNPASAPNLSLPTSTDQFLTCTTTPPYAHSYHLSSVLGPDYVDVSKDGPSDDDLGYWVRFDYVQVANYGYRSPYYGAHYTRGFERSYLTDDRGSFTYGKKSLMFLGRAVTATHQALFALSAAALEKGKQCYENDDFLSLPPDARTDARGAAAPAQNPPSSPGSPAGAATQPRLLGAFLCRRGDSVPIKAAYLEHDYSLAAGVPNGDPTKGKLTLRKLWFEHGRDASGKRSPYEFAYALAGDDQTIVNPSYQSPGKYGDKNSDRWGTFQSCLPEQPYAGTSTADTRCSNGKAPYTRQLSPAQPNDGANAAAWNLRAISTPSRGRLEVDYEPDDYAFVQDERAAVMVPANVVAGATCGDTVPTSKFDSPKVPEVCVDLAQLGFVDAPSATQAPALAESMIKNARSELVPIAFAGDMKLRSDLLGGGEMWAPVSGYLEPTASQVASVCTASKCEVRFALKVARVKGKSYHPLAFAGWQHLKLNQPQYGVPGVSPPDVTQSTGDQLESQARGLVSMVVRIKDIFDNFAERASAEGWASKVQNLRVRLFMPTGKKRGGGTRVKQLRMCEGTACDQSTPGASMGKTYSYVMGDDEKSVMGQPISSGVAAYEPALGGDEIALRHPEFFSDENVWAPNDPTYFEHPVGESLFPDPVVGYRRVVERTLAASLAADWQQAHPADAPVSLAGEREHEFYTAKDFPVRTEASALQHPNSVHNVLTVPGVGTILHEEFAASQGFRVELNDMHGKPRRVAEYSLKPDGTRADGVDRQTTYLYDVTGNRVDPSIPAVHLRDKQRRPSTSFGQRVEYYADLRQSISSTNNMGLNINTDVMQIGPWPVPIPVPWPAYDDSEKESRTSTFHQIVHRSGVLIGVETRDRSVTRRTDSLAFDFNRGAPVLTSTTDAFGDAIFDLNVPAYWLHPGMGPELTNQIGATGITLRSATNPFTAAAGICCAPEGIQTLRVGGVLDASATLFGHRGLLDLGLLAQHAPALLTQFDGLLFASGAGESVWRPIVTYRVDDVRKYAPSPSPSTDGRFANHVTIPISELPSVSHSDAAAASAPLEQLPTAFDELGSTCTASHWKRTERFASYHPQGPAIQSFTPLGGQDAVLYAHHASVVQAVGQNAGYDDIGFEGFEAYTPDKDLELTDLDDGNIDFWTVFDETPVARTDDRLPGHISDGVIVWDPDPRPPFGGGDIDPLPPDIRILVDSHLGDPVELEPEIDHIERRGDRVVAVPSQPLPFSDRSITIESTRLEKVVGIKPTQLKPSNWLGKAWEWLFGGKTPRVWITKAAAHTGARSLAIKDSVVYGQTRLKPTHEGTFVLSAWVSRQSSNVPTFKVGPGTDLAGRLGLGVVVGGTVTEDSESGETQTVGGTSSFFEPMGPVIDGWQRVEGEFSYSVGSRLTFFFQSGDGDVFYVDDLRVFPKDSSLHTFVYEPRTLRMTARLDENNIATRWQYDQDGQLRFAERETERGWRSVSENLNHLAELPVTAPGGGG